MNAYLQHALDLAAEGLLTQLPTQLITAAVAAAVTAWIRAGRKRRAARNSEGKAGR